MQTYVDQFLLTRLRSIQILRNHFRGGGPKYLQNITWGGGRIVRNSARPGPRLIFLVESFNDHTEHPPEVLQTLIKEFLYTKTQT